MTTPRVGNAQRKVSSLSGLIWRPSAIFPDPIASLARGGWEEIAGRASRARRSPRNERGERLGRGGKRTADGDPTFDLCRGRRTDSACAVRRSVPLASASRLFATRASCLSGETGRNRRTRARKGGARFAKRQKRSFDIEIPVPVPVALPDIPFRTECQSYFFSRESQRNPGKGTSAETGDPISGCDVRDGRRIYIVGAGGGAIGSTRPSVFFDDRNLGLRIQNSTSTLCARIA